jgi:acyl-CoA thioesterase-1
LPDPDGPIRARLSPASTASVIPRRISTGPALPFRVSRASRISRTVLIKSALARFFTYGPFCLIRNVTLLLLLALSPVPALATVTIAALGDSLTAGYGLPAEQGFTAQLQAWLRAKGQDVTIMNAGVSGDTSAGGLNRLDWTLTPEVKALIVNLGANDMLRGINPAKTRANLDAILKRAAARHIPILLIGIKSTLNYGPDYKTQFDAIYPDLAKEYHTLFFPDYFGPFYTGTPDPSGIVKYLQDDHLHPNTLGVSTIVAALGPQVIELLKQVAP